MLKDKFSGTLSFSGTQFCLGCHWGQCPPLVTPWGHKHQLHKLSGPDGTRGKEFPIKTLHIPLGTLPVAAITQKRKLGREAALCPARLLPTTAKWVKTVITISHHSLAQCKCCKLNCSQSCKT